MPPRRDNEAATIAAILGWAAGAVLVAAAITTTGYAIAGPWGLALGPLFVTAAVWWLRRPRAPRTPWVSDTETVGIPCAERTCPLVITARVDQVMRARGEPLTLTCVSGHRGTYHIPLIVGVSRG